MPVCYTTYMLSKPNRLARRRDFDALFKKGRVASEPSLQLRTSPTKPLEPTRFAFVISVKTEKTAVARNRAKRQLRGIVRALLPSIVPGYDGAFTIKRAFLSLDHEKQVLAVRKLLQKARMLK